MMEFLSSGVFITCRLLAPLRLLNIYACGKLLKHCNVHNGCLLDLQSFMRCAKTSKQNTSSRVPAATICSVCVQRRACGVALKCYYFWLPATERRCFMLCEQTIWILVTACQKKKHQTEKQREMNSPVLAKCGKAARLPGLWRTAMPTGGYNVRVGWCNACWLANVLTFIAPPKLPPAESLHVHITGMQL